MSSVARHERCNTFSTRRVFLIHLEIPCCIYIIFLFKIYTYYYVFCYTSSWWDVFSNTFTSVCTFFEIFGYLTKYLLVDMKEAQFSVTRHRYWSRCTVQTSNASNIGGVVLYNLEFSPTIDPLFA